MHCIVRVFITFIKLRISMLVEELECTFLAWKFRSGPTQKYTTHSHFAELEK